ncbi:bifunctional aspartate kinase/homoserine dehydrogenase I [Thiotrichales bacterium 19S9-12]|nr:bifunctional aspartate kinase/homoserine dehydrogenase I [Thiotrichales bacterium 19S9-11]MCF6812236.1 bifunctional aspartate kinase/homoserine dehydrogenase I [Thiotrichales bacterium 19S9-12]
MQVVHKFGGSSLGDENKINNVISIIKGKKEVVVVSAIGKTTQHLRDSIDQAVLGQDYKKSLLKIKKQHASIIQSVAAKSSKTLMDLIEKNIENISDLLTTMHLTKIVNDNIQNYILGYGEIWSAKILTAALNQKKKKAQYISAFDVLMVDDSNYPVLVDWEKSQQTLDELVDKKYSGVYVITGFIARNEKGHRTILGMNCSDYSAAIFAKLFNVSELIIWTDVEGVYSANPSQVPTARQVKHLAYKEALELAYFGASVVHPLTIGPMMEKKIPIYIKSSYKQDGIGTEISNRDVKVEKDQARIKGLTSANQVSLIKVQGAGMIGVSGIASKIFTTLYEANISVMMISQASSEYSICFAVNVSEGNKAVKLLSKTFAYEIERGVIEKIQNDKNYSLITAVGDQMRNTPGSLAKMVNPLAHANINIHAVAQGSSERSITLTVKEEFETEALNLIHQEYIDHINEVAVVIIGCGNIAKALVEQIANAKSKLEGLSIKFKLVAITNSKKMIITNDDLMQSDWQQMLKKSKKAVNLDAVLTHLKALKVKYRLVIDATDSIDVAKSYLKFLSAGISVITPNKYANTLTMDYYHQLRKAQYANPSQFKYETNVCAGLPIIQTLQDMIITGDKIKEIKGVFSGTLSYVFNQINLGVRFSDAVKKAYELGYTEPDPREDLSGMDVARKLVILAREIGLSVEMSDLNIQDLTPKGLKKCTIDEFLSSLDAHDDKVEKLLSEIKGNKAGIHYIGTISASGKIQIGIDAFEQSSEFSRLQGTENLVKIHSKRYHQYPMIIQGPGAGADVTAEGVFSDILKVIY